MKKLDEPKYKILQYSRWIGGSAWELGFSLMDMNETYGWEFRPSGRMVSKRDRYYPISDTYRSKDYYTFSYGF